MTKDVLDLHCAHERPVYRRCSECEADAAAGKSTGFTPPGERVPASSAETKSDEGYDANGSPVTNDLIPASAFPERIYLQRDEECVADGCGPHGSDTTWCTDKIYDTDVPYVRADISLNEIEMHKRRWMEQSDYAIQLQRLIERFCSGDEIPYPQLHHHKMLSDFRANLLNEIEELKRKLSGTNG